MGFLFGNGGIFAASPGRGNVVSLDTSLGNTILVGNSPRGIESVMRNYLIDALNKGNAVVILRNGENGFSAYPSVVNMRGRIYDVDVAEDLGAEQIDGFSGYSDREQDMAMLQTMEMYNQIDPAKKMKFQNYISIVRSLLATRKKRLRLNELYQYNVDEVEMLNASAPIPDAEKMRNERFFNSFRADIFEFETYFYEFSNNAVGHILSGAKSLETIFASKNVIEISFDFKSHETDSNVLLHALVNVLGKFNCAAAGKRGLTVAVNEIPNESLEQSGLQKLIKNTPNCNVIYSVADISKLIEKTNDWIEYADSYFFLRQTSDKNKEFSSSFFGTYEKQKVSTNQSRSTPSFWDRLNNRGAVTSTSGTTVTTEKERVYQPDDFAVMPENEAIYFFKKTNSHSRIRLF
ncbi:MAG: hypothetical protein IKJ35_05500 [Clostridia bacterium]|nr:hypothetical protein [Clostridia bacterium]